MVCNDGFTYDWSIDYSLCKNHGGRKICPNNTVMCADYGCANGGFDFCCEDSVSVCTSKYGGLRPCANVYDTQQNFYVAQSTLSAIVIDGHGNDWSPSLSAPVLTPNITFLNPKPGGSVSGYWEAYDTMGSFLSNISGWFGYHDATSKVAFTWDQTNVYMLVTVTDEWHTRINSENSFDTDAIQFAFGGSSYVILFIEK